MIESYFSCKYNDYEMNLNCKTKLKDILQHGTKLDKKIAIFLLENKDSINKINKLSELSEVPLSTTSRFIGKLNYPSFKHFIYEYNDKYECDSLSNNKNDSIMNFQKMYDEINELSKKIIGKIFILTSRRSKCLGNLINHRLSEAKIDNRLFNEEKDSIENFIQKCKNNTIILISLSGYSNLFSKAIHEIAKLPNNEKPQIIILTAAMWMKIFDKYEYISIGKLKKKKYCLDNWSNYNEALSDIMPIVVSFLNNIMHEKGKH